MTFPGQFPPPAGFPAPQTAQPQQHAQPAPAGFPQQVVQGQVGYAPNYGAPQMHGFSSPTMPMMGLGDLEAQLQTAEESDDRTPPLPIGPHELFENLQIRIERSTNPNRPHAINFLADCRVLKSATVPAGTPFTFQAWLVGHPVPKKQPDDIARVRSFLAVLSGLDPNGPEARQHVTLAVIMSFHQAPKAYAGRQGAIANVAHRVSKPKVNPLNGQTIPPQTYATYTFALPGKVQALPAQPTPVATAPVVQPQTQFPPAGWASAEPTYPGHYHNGKECIPEAALRALMAAGRA